MVFSNYIYLVPGIPKRMHFTDWYDPVGREIYDKELGRPKRVMTSIFYVDEEDGEPVSKTFSILSQKLKAHFLPYTTDNEYRDYDFIITEYGEGFYKDWNVQVVKRV